MCSDWCKSEEAVGLERHLRGGLQQLRGENWKSARRLQQLGGEKWRISTILPGFETVVENTSKEAVSRFYKR